MKDVDEAFVSELKPWGWLALGLVVSMMLIAVLMDDRPQRWGYVFFALLVFPLVWIEAGRYAAHCLRRGRPRAAVRVLYVGFLSTLAAKIIMLPVPGGRFSALLALATFVAALVFAILSFRDRIAPGDVASYASDFIGGCEWLVDVSVAMAWLLLMLAF